MAKNMRPTVAKKLNLPQKIIKEKDILESQGYLGSRQTEFGDKNQESRHEQKEISLSLKLNI